MPKSDQLKIGDSVRINTAWADKEFPNCDGVVSGLRHGGSVAVITTNEGRSPRALHTAYFQRS